MTSEDKSRLLIDVNLHMVKKRRELFPDRNERKLSDLEVGFDVGVVAVLKLIRDIKCD